jgi:hypothetical protein
MEIKKASTDISVYFHLRNSSDGTSKTGLVYNSAGAVASYVRNRGTRTAITLATLAAADSAHSDGGFKEVDGTNAKGLYRLDLPDAALATGVDDVVILIGFTGVFEGSLRIELVDNIEKDTYDIVNNVTYGNAQLVRATTPANTLDIEAGGTAGIDFSNTNGTHPTVPTVTDVTNDVGITQVAADKVWSSTIRTLTSYGTLINDIWHQLLTSITTAGSIGKLIKDNLDATISSRGTSDFDYTANNVTVGTNNDKTGYSISGTKTTLDALNDVSTAEVNAECDTALTDYDGPTNAEMEARTLVAANYFDPVNDTVVNVTLTATTTNVTNQVTADVTAISGDSVAADNLELDYDGTGYDKSNSTIGTCTTNTDMRGREEANIQVTIVGDGSNTTSTFKTNLTSATDDFYKAPTLLRFKTGNNASQVSKLLASSSYDGTTKFITVSPAFANIPANNDTCELIII